MHNNIVLGKAARWETAGLNNLNPPNLFRKKLRKWRE